MGKSKASGSGNGEIPAGLPPGAVPKETFTEQLPVPVDPASIMQAAQSLAALADEQEILDNERRDANAGFKERQSSIKDRQKSLSKTVKEGVALQDVKCQDWLLPDNQVWTVRLDTGEILKDADDKPISRTADAEDLQEKLAPVGKDAAEGSSAEAPAGA